MVAHTLRAGGHDASEDGTGRGTPLVVSTREIAQAITSNYGKQPDNSDTALGPNLVCAFTERTRADGRSLEAQACLAYSLTDGSKGGNPHSGKIAGGFGVRRLTPVECEKLQGFSVGWTAYGHDGKAMSDSARYRMLGNAVCVPTVEWIARRIAAMEGAADG